MRYIYRAKDARGKEVSGEVNAINEQQGRQLLAARGMKVLSFELPKPAAPSKAISKEQNQSEVSLSWRVVGGALAALALVCAVVLTMRPKPQSNETATKVVPKKKIVLSGVVPTQSVDYIHASFAGAAIQLDKKPSELGQPGQAFKWEVEVPPDAGPATLEASYQGRRWTVSHSLPQQANLTVPPITAPPLLAMGERPFPSKIKTPDKSRPNAKDRKKQLKEQRKKLEDRMKAHHQHRDGKGRKR